jgi:hypothetical protein
MSRDDEDLREREWNAMARRKLSRLDKVFLFASRAGESAPQNV